MDLMGNAIDRAGPGGSVVVSADYRSVHRDLEICVSYTGAPFSEEEMKLLYPKLQRPPKGGAVPPPKVDPSTGTAVLGLVLGRDILRAMGGELAVERTEKGAAFRARVAVINAAWRDGTGEEPPRPRRMRGILKRERYNRHVVPLSQLHEGDEEGEILQEKGAAAERGASGVSTQAAAANGGAGHSSAHGQASEGGGGGGAHNSGHPHGGGAQHNSAHGAEHNSENGVDPLAASQSQHNTRRRNGHAEQQQQGASGAAAAAADPPGTMPGALEPSPPRPPRKPAAAAQAAAAAAALAVGAPPPPLPPPPGAVGIDIDAPQGRVRRRSSGGTRVDSDEDEADRASILADGYEHGHRRTTGDDPPPASRAQGVAQQAAYRGLVGKGSNAAGGKNARATPHIGAKHNNRIASTLSYAHGSPYDIESAHNGYPGGGYAGNAGNTGGGGLFGSAINEPAAGSAMGAFGGGVGGVVYAHGMHPDTIRVLLADDDALSRRVMTMLFHIAQVRFIQFHLPRFRPISSSVPPILLVQQKVSRRR